MRPFQLSGSALRRIVAPAMGGVLLVTVSGQVAAASTLTVCPSGCAYTEIGPAVAAAHDGDTIKIGAGTYVGRITIDVSVALIGAGAGKTVIEGGGPVVTIGAYAARTEPTVTISGVTVTGGVSHSSLLSEDWFGAEGIAATGGGIEILPKADANGGFIGGARVTIIDSEITGNRTAPTETRPWGPPCPGGPCAFSWAKGGGIDSFGDLTLVDTTVSNNTAAGLASDANGGGINVWWTGTLTLTRSSITGNRAVAAVPVGRYAEGGGIFMDGGVALTITDSQISRNVATLTSTLPYVVDGANGIDMNANGGGIHVGDGSSVTITGTEMSANVASVVDPYGEPYAFDAALHPGDGPLVLRDSTISNNRVSADVGSSAHVGPSGTAIDINGPATVSHVRITGNASTVTSSSGDAWVAAGGLYTGYSGSKAILITSSVIRDNSATASSESGSVTVVGAGLLNEGRLHLVDSLITDNVGTAYGTSGVAQGGGIWNGSIFDPTVAQVTLDGTTISHNRLVGDAAVTDEGGGVFTVRPITLHGSLITHNQPDDCSGC